MFKTAAEWDAVKDMFAGNWMRIGIRHRYSLRSRSKVSFKLVVDALAWVDGTRVAYRDWMGEIRATFDSGDEADCMYYYEDGHLNDLPCSKKMEFLCQI